MVKKTFEELELSPEILKAVHAMGFEEASPIQSAAIPVLRVGGDVIGQSQTGSGKTAAFAIPSIEKVDPKLAATQVLILCPTRELAVQVAEETARLAAYKKGVRELPIYGGQSYERQFRGLKKGAHIVIGTPGRVLDHLEKGTLKLDHLQTIILDEADRMLDMGFLEDIQKVLEQMPAERQTVLFSATIPRPIAELIKTFTTNPTTVKIESQQMAVPEIEQVWYEVDRRTKLDVLCRIIDMEDIHYGIIFCATKVMVDGLTEHLTARGYLSDKLHGDMTQAMRERVMNRFRKRNLEFLVATDVAARGLDVKDIQVVFNYDLPNDGEDYVHRIGRTGRAGSDGKAITFVAGRELYKLQNIMRFTKGKIRREKVPTVEMVEKRKANVFFENLRETLEKKTYRRFDDFTDRLLEQGYAPTDIISALVHLRGGDGGVSDSPVKENPLIDSPPKGKGKVSKYDRAGDQEKSPFRKKEKKNKKDRKKNAAPTTAIVLELGSENGIRVADVLGVILGAARIPKNDIGFIKLNKDHAIVEMPIKHAETAIGKLDGIQFKKQLLRVHPQGSR
ncbi:MAG: DEAD/DEAH box helicase [Opitutales bacterium]|nr:DEAD/DEAH box helicase [Opitutales bacterium]